ncbi:MAG: MerR family transcriptional regulator [Acidobacteriia bacterium]|nr:MerR family transcriptional regulator [Terriglobia bacterium]
MGRHYKIHEFAKLAGVTVKALHHYDRLGLLQPGRTEAGYRVYLERDMETLEQIVALKFLGLPLKQIRVVLKRAAQLPDALRLQRRALEDKHALLGRAIRAIQAAEESLESGKPADAAILKTIIEVIDMQDGIAVMKKYYSEEAWERHRRYYEEGPSPEWRQLYRDTEALLGTDPGSEPAQELVERWFELSRRAYTGDPEVQTDSPKAWMDREHWPPIMKQRIAEFKVEEASAFIKLAALSSRKRYFSEGAWAKLMKLRENEKDHSRMWQARVDLFRDIEKALGEDPAGEIAQALVARWKAQQDDASGGDPEIKAGLLRGWSNRRNWPPSMRWQVEALHMMSFERFEKAADFLDRAQGKEGAPVTTTRQDKMETLLAEFDQEMANTRRMLERVPEGKFAWKPHDKSSTLAKLASHIAAIPVGAAFVITGQGTKPSESTSTLELLETFDKRVSAAREALAGTNQDHLAGTIQVNPGITKTREAALKWMMSHMIHHRGQLSVYLRLIGVAVPGMYGPSADEKS